MVWWWWGGGVSVMVMVVCVVVMERKYGDGGGKKVFVEVAMEGYDGVGLCGEEEEEDVLKQNEE